MSLNEILVRPTAQAGSRRGALRAQRGEEVRERRDHVDRLRIEQELQLQAVQHRGQQRGEPVGRDPVGELAGRLGRDNPWAIAARTIS